MRHVPRMADDLRYSSIEGVAAHAKNEIERRTSEFMEFLPVLSFDGYSMSQLKAADVIDYLTRGVSSSMLARRWNSPELLTFDLKSWQALLENPTVLASLEKIEMFRNITNDLTAMISTNKELREKSLAKEKLTEDTVNPGDELHGIDDLTAVAVVTDNYGLSVGGIRHESPMRLQRPLVIEVMDGRSVRIDDGHGPKPLSELG